MITEKTPWIAEREATVCTWKMDYNRGFMNNMSASLLVDFMSLSNRQLGDYAQMMKECGYTGIQVTDMCSAWRASGSWETVHDKYKVLADACHDRGMHFTLWCWAAEFSGHGWSDPQAAYQSSVPGQPAYLDPAVRAFFERYYDIYADMAPYCDRVIAHFFDPGNLTDMESILFFTRLLWDKFRAKNPGIKMAIDTWGCPSEYPSELVKAGMTDIMLMELPFLPIWREPGKRAAFREGVKRLNCGLGSWGWYTCEYEIDQFPLMSVNSRVLADVYRQTREQGDGVLVPAYWSEMDSYHILNFFSMYCSGHLLINPDADPDALLRDAVRAITGDNETNYERLLRVAELIRDARSGDTWDSYWWTEPGYCLEHAPYGEILRRADGVIGDVEALIGEAEPADGIAFPLTRKQFYRLILPHLHQIRQFARFRVEFDALKEQAAGMPREQLQERLNALPYVIPEYNCTIGVFGQTEFRAAYKMIKEYCTGAGLTVPPFTGMLRHRLKQRFLEMLIVFQREKQEPLFVEPIYYGILALGLDDNEKIMEELTAEGVLFKNEEGRYALTNWQDYRFDISM